MYVAQGGEASQRKTDTEWFTSYGEYKKTSSGNNNSQKITETKIRGTVLQQKTCHQIGDGKHVLWKGIQGQWSRRNLSILEQVGGQEGNWDIVEGKWTLVKVLL